MSDEYARCPGENKDSCCWAFPLNFGMTIITFASLFSLSLYGNSGLLYWDSSVVASVICYVALVIGIISLYILYGALYSETNEGKSHAPKGCLFSIIANFFNCIGMSIAGYWVNGIVFLVIGTFLWLYFL